MSFYFVVVRKMEVVFQLTSISVLNNPLMKTTEAPGYLLGSRRPRRHFCFASPDESGSKDMKYN